MLLSNCDYRLLSLTLKYCIIKARSYNLHPVERLWLSSVASFLHASPWCWNVMYLRHTLPPCPVTVPVVCCLFFACVTLTLECCVFEARFRTLVSRWRKWERAFGWTLTSPKGWEFYGIIKKSRTTFFFSSSRSLSFSILLILYFWPISFLVVFMRLYMLLRSFICPSIRLSTHLSIRPSVRMYVRPSAHLSHF